MEYKIWLFMLVYR